MASPPTKGPWPEDIDPFFHLEPGGEFNACIGRQADVENYIDGYMEAAQELVAAVIDKRQFGKRDTLAMPILYNARHAVELSLKFAIEHLHQLGRLPQSHRANHDINGQFVMLRDGKLGDEVARQTVAGLEPFVTSLSSIDEDGQELRYAVNRDGKKSLEAFALIDLELVRIGLDELAKLLDTLKYRVTDLHQEKASGTWTADCSRSDLIAIAKMLPARGDWDSDAFVEAKAAAMERFGLSGKRFTAALKVIEASRGARQHIGIDTELAHLTDAHAMLVVELWAERHPPRKAKGDGEAFSVVRRNRDWEAARAHRQKANALNGRIIGELAPNEIADLETVFYMGRQRTLPEFYEEMLARALKEHALARDLTIKVEHLMQKTNLADELRNGLLLLGRPTLAQQIADFLKARGS